MRLNSYEAASFWNSAAVEFDSIYSGRNKSAGALFFDRVFRRDIYQRFDWVMERCGDLRGQTACDIGCGPGQFVKEFAQRGAGLSVGLDIAPDMLTLARQRASRAGVAHRCEFVLSEVDNWKTTEKFDIAIAIGLWDYIQDPRVQLSKIRTLTRGRFLSAWPRLWTWRMPIRKVRLEYLRGCPVYFYRRAEIYRMLECAGFSVARCDVVGKLFCVEAH